MIMMILSKMAVTDLYSHHETNEDVMRGRRNTVSPAWIVLVVTASKPCTCDASKKKSMHIMCSDYPLKSI